MVAALGLTVLKVTASLLEPVPAAAAVDGVAADAAVVAAVDAVAAVSLLSPPHELTASAMAASAATEYVVLERLFIEFPSWGWVSGAREPRETDVLWDLRAESAVDRFVDVADDA
jgi:hypothetical protein